MPFTRLLLVEDNPDHQALMASVLRRGCPYVVLRTVARGSEVLAAVEESPFDCILLDYNLPDTRADTLIADLKRGGHTCPVIVMSSSNEQDVVIKSMRSGCVDFVPKTEAVQGDHLWRRVQAAIKYTRDQALQRRVMERRVERLAQLAESDPLTGLANRFSMDRLLHGRRRQLDRRGRVACVMIDLDHFKSINDQYGHKAGDDALRAVADLLRSHQEEGPVCRWGGEEFVAILPGYDEVTGYLWADHFRQAVEGLEVRSAGHRIPLTASLGLHVCGSAVFGEQIVAQADQALYLAKHRGRNRLCTYDMVRLEHIVEEVLRLPGMTVLDRLEAVMERAQHMLGPTQHQHLTYHAHRVMEITRYLAETLGTDEATMERLRVAALYHDLGKCVVPESLLARPGALTDEERLVLQRHAVEGAYIAQRLGVDPATVAIIRHHHAWFADRCDAGAASSKIPWEAGVLSVADALDAMTSRRAYRPSSRLSDALDELIRGRGSQFAPDVVDAAIAFLEQGRLETPVPIQPLIHI